MHKKRLDYDYKNLCKRLHQVGIKLDPKSSKFMESYLKKGYSNYNQMVIIIENDIKIADYLMKTYLQTFRENPKDSGIRVSKIPSTIATLRFISEEGTIKYKLEISDEIKERLKMFRVPLYDT